MKESLIRARIIFGIQDNTVRDRLLREAELTLRSATENVRAAEHTQVQLKQIKADKTIDESIIVIKTEGGIPEKGRKTRNKAPVIDCQYCGRKHPRDKNQCPVYGARCQKCGLSNYFAVKCRKGSSQTKRLHLVEVDEDDQEEFFINVVAHEIGSLEGNQSESSANAPSQLFATMTVNEKAKVKFQLHCGATCNILPLKDYIRAMEESDYLYVQRSNAKLSMCNGTVIYPVGKCKLKYELPGQPAIHKCIQSPCIMLNPAVSLQFEVAVFYFMFLFLMHVLLVNYTTIEMSKAESQFIIQKVLHNKTWLHISRELLSVLFQQIHWSFDVPSW